PSIEAGQRAECSALLVAALEVDAAIPAGHARLVGHRVEGLPGEHDWLGRGYARLDLRAAGREGHLRVEVVRPEELVDHCPTGRAERAVTGDVLGKARGDDVERLVRQPALARDLAVSLLRAEPGCDHLAAVALPDPGGRPLRVVLVLGGPGEDA